ncbi:hypothetical protein BN126360319 [Stenotrophomonas indicatrix]|nr:hypothetical protein BN126360319 [Stenotrophomonas indicatrix]
MSLQVRCAATRGVALLRGQMNRTPQSNRQGGPTYARMRAAESARQSRHPFGGAEESPGSIGQGAR